jgi:acetolactate synthase-1/2/3 large subunit
VETQTGGELLLDSLRCSGVKYILANTGTDYPAILEAAAKLQSNGMEWPKLLVVPHEMVAVSIAHGYAALTGEPQVVMVHTLPGTANVAGGIMNASRSLIPIIIHAGRTPVTEYGLKGSRDLHIHWAQESRDQASVVREFVKWDFEVRQTQQVPEIVLRARKIALTEPKGPVYIIFPRELTIQQIPKPSQIPVEKYGPPSPPQADMSALEKAASILTTAREPVILTKRLGRDPLAVNELIKLAELLAIPVVGSVADYVNFPNNHPMSIPRPLPNADVVFVIDSDLPWIPSIFKPSDSAKIIHLDIDPSYASYPFWNFPAHMAMTGTSRLALSVLYELCKRKITADLEGSINERGAKIRQMHDRWRTQALEQAINERLNYPISSKWLSHCIGEIKDSDTIVVNEYDFDPDYAVFAKPGTYFFESSLSCLGWGLGAAMGAKLARPESTVCATVGDGAYIFGNPTASHFVATAYRIPTLTVIYNNESWDAVRSTIRETFPDGCCANTGNFIGSDLKPSPKFELVAAAHGAYSRTVTEPNDVLDGLRACLEVLRGEERSALLDVKCAPT